jgi:Phosphotransferase enzyme family
VTVPPVASDPDLLAALPGAVSITRRPYPYATSCPLTSLQVGFADGRAETLLLKDLAPQRLLGQARESKPTAVYEPRREIDTYAQILSPRGIGPRYVTSGPDWLVLELVDGRELWQVGDLDVWAAVARWLAAFHAEFAGRVEEVRRASPHLLALDADLVRRWVTGARAAPNDAQGLRAALDRLPEAISAMPRTLVHGEFYPANILVAGALPNLRVCPVDWEMAATGPGLVDLAALTTGWDPAHRRRLIAAYGDVDEAALDWCRLYLAVQWLAWAPGWVAPAEHARDWLGEALAAAGRLGW